MNLFPQSAVHISEYQGPQAATPPISGKNSSGEVDCLARCYLLQLGQASFDPGVDTSVLPSSNNWKDLGHTVSKEGEESNERGSCILRKLQVSCDSLDILCYELQRLAKSDKGGSCPG
ncbi:hypothetical protein R3P38DRAFT_2792252 [Favolaschia claudopus]|uniref:Uncharacterized protein n=1 Tax=Favolaschia claudopus TaxID=2862362 RepID=A0AAW0AFP6_9AGAR